MRLGLALLTVGLLGCSAAAPTRAPVTAMPAVPVAMLDGQRVAIDTVLRGRVALVTLWATWCEACQREVGALNRLTAATAGRDDALVLGIAVGEPLDKVARACRERGVRYSQVVDEDFHLADALGQRDVPATLVVDKSGRITYRGEALDARAMKAFQAALEPETASLPSSSR